MRGLIKKKMVQRYNERGREGNPTGLKLPREMCGNHGIRRRKMAEKWQENGGGRVFHGDYNVVTVGEFGMDENGSRKLHNRRVLHERGRGATLILPGPRSPIVARLRMVSGHAIRRPKPQKPSRPRPRRETPMNNENHSQPPAIKNPRHAGVWELAGLLVNRPAHPTAHPNPRSRPWRSPP